MNDPVGYGTIALAIKRLRIEGMPEAFAGSGVFPDNFIAVLRGMAPNCEFQFLGGIHERDGSKRFSLALCCATNSESAIAELEFFYPRLFASAYFFLRDSENPESRGIAKQSMETFLRDKPEKLIDIPDEWGTVLFRKKAA